jgi:hypothetical protein
LAIEVRQLTITSAVRDGSGPGRADRNAEADQWQREQRLKDEILSECRRMMAELRDTARER